MNENGNALISFVEESGEEHRSGAKAAPWRVLIVDDDEDVHHTTEFALNDVLIIERPLEFLHAYSSAEAIEVLRCERNIAVILLDVVMESENAGLVAVRVIRQELMLANTRIILRTGQPGSAPEMETIRRYDINDYKTKSELTRNKLFTTLTAAIRSYDQLCRLDASRRGLEHIVAASNRFISEPGIAEFAAGVITQIASLIGVEPEGMVCACADGEPPRSLHIIAAAGRFAQYRNASIHALSESGIVERLERSIELRQNLIDDESLTLFFPGSKSQDFAAYIAAPVSVQEIDKHLLEVFCTNIGICGENIGLVEKLKVLAYTDQLLGIPNRRAFVEAVDYRLDKGCLANCSIALVDVDQFAETNDMFGHSYGDRLLARIAERLVEYLDPSCMVARIANDTFGLFGDEKFIRPEVLRPLFHASFDIDGIDQPVSMSMGLVRISVEAASGNDLLKDASIALKRAKSSGQGQYAYYSADVATETRERTRLLHDLRHAFKQDSLYVVYQPQIELASGRLCGLEALLRWRTRHGDFISPERFVPVAEQSGLIIGLGNWVLRTALHSARHLQDAGHAGLRMAVNVSAVQFRQPNFLELVDQALANNGVAPNCLELEITESVAIMGSLAVQSILLQLKARGIAIAIDDFGTGYSSLSYLDKLPADRLKIDRAFVWALDSGKDGARIAEMVVPLGHRLGMKVLAEGVENASQADALRQIGCDEVQGFLFGRPMTLEDLEKWITAFHPHKA